MRGESLVGKSINFETLIILSNHESRCLGN
jgi:hypothetical protein